MLSVQPVHDTDSVYRDSIGVLADVLVLLLSRKPQCEKYGGLCRLLPSSFAPEAAALTMGVRDRADRGVGGTRAVRAETLGEYREAEPAIKGGEHLGADPRDGGSAATAAQDDVARRRKGVGADAKASVQTLRRRLASVQTLVGHAPSVASFREHLKQRSEAAVELLSFVVVQMHELNESETA
jgi:hypothetical protein